MMSKLEKNFDWLNFFRCHPVFFNLSEKEIEDILDDNISKEKIYKANEVIVSQGDIDQKVFLIGKGSVEVILKSEDSQKEINLVSLKRGEIIGEMALLENKPRSATLKAIENCALLQIHGDEFKAIVNNHPELEFKVLAQLSQRLRKINSKMIAIQKIDIDDKLELFDSKLNAQLKVFDAALNAAQAVFDQTNIRTNEVITSVERSQMQAKLFLATLGTFITVTSAIAGWFGFSKYDNLMSKLNAGFDEIETISKDARQIKPVLEKTKIDLSKFSEFYDEFTKFEQAVSLQRFIEILDSETEIHKAKDFFMRISKGETNRALNEVSIRIFKKKDSKYRNYTTILKGILDISKSSNAKISLSTNDRIHVYFLFLTNSILIGENMNDSSIKKIQAKFKNSIKEYTGRNNDQKFKIDLSKAENAFKDSTASKQRKYEQIKKLLQPLI